MLGTFTRDVILFAAGSLTITASLAKYGRYNQNSALMRLASSAKDQSQDSIRASWLEGSAQTIPFENKKFKSFLSNDLRKAGGLYSLAISAVIPRPIALVTSQDSVGNINCAPYSYFNLVSHDPPLVIIGNSLNVRSAIKKKDTLRNIEETGNYQFIRMEFKSKWKIYISWAITFILGQFVVNIMSDWYVESANHCSGAFPHDVNELEKAGLSSLPSDIVKPPRVGSAAVQLECEVLWFQIIFSPIVRLLYDFILHLLLDISAYPRRK